MKKISDIMRHNHSPLAKLLTTQDTLKKINSHLGQISLFSTYLDCYRIIKFSQGILYLSVSTAALATQLRYATPQIIRTLQQQLTGIDLKSIQIKVGTLKTSTPQITPYRNNKTKAMNDKVRATLHKLSETIDSKELRTALQRLGRFSEEHKR